MSWLHKLICGTVLAAFALLSFSTCASAQPRHHYRHHHHRHHHHPH